MQRVWSVAIHNQFIVNAMPVVQLKAAKRTQRRVSGYFQLTMTYLTQPLPERADMRNDLITGAAAITAEVLRQTQGKYDEITEDLIATAFEKAYCGLEAGILRVTEREVRESFQ